MSSNSTLYFDYAATTPLDKEVLDAMLPFLTTEYGNANSAHHLGQRAKVIVEDAREQIADIIGAEPSEIIFTSGGTESDNAVIQGVMALAGDKNELITSPGEHHAVLHPIELSKVKGFKPVMAPLNNDGIVELETLEELITDKTCLVSLMHVNNEIGSVNDLKKLSDLCHKRGVLFHTDAVQSLGKIPVNVKELRCRFLSGSAHKIYGPKGIGLNVYTQWKSLDALAYREALKSVEEEEAPQTYLVLLVLQKLWKLQHVQCSSSSKPIKNSTKHLLGELKTYLHVCEWEINGKPGVHHITNFCFQND